MSKILMKTELAASAEEIWRAIGRFGALADWNPLVERVEAAGEVAGAERRVRIKGLAGTVVERLESVSDGQRSYRYTVVGGPLPVSKYSAEVRVVDNGDGTSTVEWSGDFEPKGVSEVDAARRIQEVYQSGLDNLAKMFGFSGLEKPD